MPGVNETSLTPERSVPFAVPDIRPADIDSVREVLLSGWLTHGRFTKSFETDFARYTEAGHALTVANCTAALHLACLAHGVGPGDEVIVPAMTHVATAHAVEYTGATAIFADVDPVTGNILCDDIRRKVSGNTRGVIVVHMAGYPCDMDAVRALCGKHSLFLIEDCAHALGTRYNGRHVGNVGSVGCFSFYPTKQIATGEGGMAVCSDDTIARFLEKHRAFGIDTPPGERTTPGLYDVRGLGYNYRMTDFQAALGYVQLLRYPENVGKRRANAKIYSERLGSLRDHVDFADFTDDCSYFLFQLLVGKQHDRDSLAAYLRKHGAGLSVHYATPAPLMSYYAEKYSLAAASFPNAVEYAGRNISLPVHMYLSEEDVNHVCDLVECYFQQSPESGS